jgi:hypothetical protein
MKTSMHPLRRLRPPSLETLIMAPLSSCPESLARR